MSHGHCGIVKAAPQALGAPKGTKKTMAISARGPAEKKKAIEEMAESIARAAIQPEYEIVNDASLELLARTSVSLARSGVDIIGASDMMDGRVGAIRAALDQVGFENTPILSYAAKFSSGFYGPFGRRQIPRPSSEIAVPTRWTRRTFARAMREIELDVEEGADMIMVKPGHALPGCDCRGRERFDLPLAAYQVSGEYAMIEAAGPQPVDRPGNA